MADYSASSGSTFAEFDPSTSSASISSRAASSTESSKVDCPWIILQILNTPESNELLSLREMFSINSGLKVPGVRDRHKYWATDPAAKTMIKFFLSLDKIGPSEKVEDHAPQDRFMDVGNGRLFENNLPIKIDHKSEGLPIYFIRKYCLEQVFVQRYSNVEFEQSLTAIDYLRDLEYTRRESLREAAVGLEITPQNWREVLFRAPDLMDWVESIQMQEEKVELYYAKIFMNLRVQVMLYQLRAEPFYKPDIIAMLNTLFPPGGQDMLNDQIDLFKLHKWRKAFYQQMANVEKNGPQVLDAFVKDILGKETDLNWREVRRTVEGYIDLAETVIIQASATHNLHCCLDGSYQKRDSCISCKSTESMKSMKSMEESIGETTEVAQTNLRPHRPTLARGLRTFSDQVMGTLRPPTLPWIKSTTGRRAEDTTTSPPSSDTTPTPLSSSTAKKPSSLSASLRGRLYGATRSSESLKSNSSAMPLRYSREATTSTSCDTTRTSESNIPQPSSKYAFLQQDPFPSSGGLRSRMFRRNKQEATRSTTAPPAKQPLFSAPILSSDDSGAERRFKAPPHLAQPDEKPSQFKKKYGDENERLREWVVAEANARKNEETEVPRLRPSWSMKNKKWGFFAPKGE